MGGPYDQAILLYGALLGGIRFNYDSNSSNITCDLQSGVFVDTELRAVELDDTDPDSDVVDANAIQPMLWGCLQTIELNNGSYAWTKIANNESTSFGFTRQVNTVPDCGERIDNAYYESGVQAISIGARVYSRNGNQWQTRMHTGGVRNDIVAPNGTSSPRRKGLQTIPNIRIATATSDGDYSCYAQFENISVKSWGNTYNINSEIVENPSLTALRGYIVIKTPDITSALISNALTARKVTYSYGTGNDLEMYYPDGFVTQLPDFESNANDSWTSDGVTYKPRQSVKITSNVTFTAGTSQVQAESES